MVTVNRSALESPAMAATFAGGHVHVAQGDYLHDFVFNVVPDAGGSGIS